MCYLEQQVAELVAEQVEFVTANLERDACLVQSESLLVNGLDALDYFLDSLLVGLVFLLTGGDDRWRS